MFTILRLFCFSANVANEKFFYFLQRVVLCAMSIEFAPTTFRSKLLIGNNHGLLFVIFAAFSCLFYEIKITSQSLAFCILHSSFYAAVSTGSVHTAI